MESSAEILVPVILSIDYRSIDTLESLSVSPKALVTHSCIGMSFFLPSVLTKIGTSLLIVININTITEQFIKCIF